MAVVSRRRGILARLLTAGGVVWLFWAVFGQVIALELGSNALDLPLLPGFVILFLGRALARARPEVEEKTTEGAARQSSQPIRSRPPTPPASVARPIELEPAAPDQARPVEPALERYEGSDGDTAMSDDMPRKSSAEMVAEARARFGKRP